jgi:hypothetical protein
MTALLYRFIVRLPLASRFAAVLAKMGVPFTSGVPVDGISCAETVAFEYGSPFGSVTVAVTTVMF